MSRFLRLSTGFRRAFLRFQDRNLQGLGGLSYYKRNGKFAVPSRMKRQGISQCQTCHVSNKPGLTHIGHDAECRAGLCVHAPSAPAAGGAAAASAAAAPPRKMRRGSQERPWRPRPPRPSWKRSRYGTVGGGPEPGKPSQ